MKNSPVLLRNLYRDVADPELPRAFVIDKLSRSAIAAFFIHSKKGLVMLKLRDLLVSSAAVLLLAQNAVAQTSDTSSRTSSDPAASTPATAPAAPSVSQSSGASAADRMTSPSTAAGSTSGTSGAS